MTTKFTSQNKYEEKMSKLGMCRVTLWIPEEHTDALIGFAATKRAEHVAEMKEAKRIERNAEIRRKNGKTS